MNDEEFERLKAAWKREILDPVDHESIPPQDRGCAGRLRPPTERLRKPRGYRVLVELYPLLRGDRATTGPERAPPQEEPALSTAQDEPAPNS